MDELPRPSAPLGGIREFRPRKQGFEGDPGATHDKAYAYRLPKLFALGKSWDIAVTNDRQEATVHDAYHHRQKRIDSDCSKQCDVATSH
jgi:hypothetical protein